MPKCIFDSWIDWDHRMLPNKSLLYCARILNKTVYVIT